MDSFTIVNSLSGLIPNGSLQQEVAPCAVTVGGSILNHDIGFWLDCITLQQGSKYMGPTACGLGNHAECGFV